MSGVVIAALVGVGIAVQVRVLGSASSEHHPLSVSLALLLPGVLAGLVWATVRREWHVVDAVTRTWWWIPLGVVGWLVVAALGAASARIGVAATLAVSIAVQLAVGLLLDMRS
jgi:uncharacterized membrane protein YdcZ (DUF606 family)